MIIELFAVLIFVTLILIYLGYYGENDVLRVSGFAMLFLLSFVLFDAGGTGIDYTIGENITKIEDSSNATLVTTTYEIDEITETYQSHWLGYLMIIISVVGFATVYFDRKNWDGRDA